MEAVTLPHAARNGQPYLESDYRILEDPTFSRLGKALRLQRTYAAVESACFRYSLPSRVDAKVIGDRRDSAWSIDNPNADRVEEITAWIEQEFADAGLEIA